MADPGQRFLIATGLHVRTGSNGLGPVCLLTRVENRWRADRLWHDATVFGAMLVFRDLAGAVVAVCRDPETWTWAVFRDEPGWGATAGQAVSAC